MHTRVLHRNIGIITGFAPLVVYGVLAGASVPSVVVALAAAMIATVLACWSDLRKRMILAWTSLLLFAGLFAAVAVLGMTAVIPWMGVLIYATLAAVTFGSIACGTPFTLQYAREMVDAVIHEKPGFIRANVVMTGMWGAVFAADFFLLCLARVMPAPAGQAAALLTYALLAAGIAVTLWYPEHLMGKNSPLPLQGGSRDSGPVPPSPERR